MTRWLLAMALAWCSLLPAAHAHTLSIAHLDISHTDGGSSRIELDLAIRDLALTFPIDANRDERVTWGELTAARPGIERWILSSVGLSTGTSACAITPTGLAVRRYDDGAYATFQFDAACNDADGLQVDYRLFFDRDPQHRALATLRDPDGTVSTAILRADQTRVALGSGRGETFPAFLREGVHHILVGYDHLAFLLSLLLTAALLRSGKRWEPVPRFRDALKHTVGIVTAFTLAHSVTLSLAALGLVTPASRWVEAAIAASVLLAALNNLWPVVVRRLWAVGFAFGLVHGFGFAGALGELGLPKGQGLLALLAFNLGVEIGQLCVVALLLPLLYALRRQAWYPRYAMPALSLAIAALAGYWLVQRLAG